jgi:hypothetical protein
MQVRTGLHWQVEHFLVYFLATSIFCLTWPRPTLSAAAGALSAAVLAKVVILARKLALARSKQI